MSEWFWAGFTLGMVLTQTAIVVGHLFWKLRR